MERKRIFASAGIYETFHAHVDVDVDVDLDVDLDGDGDGVVPGFLPIFA